MPAPRALLPLYNNRLPAATRALISAHHASCNIILAKQPAPLTSAWDVISVCVTHLAALLSPLSARAYNIPHAPAHLWLFVAHPARLRWMRGCRCLRITIRVWRVSALPPTGPVSRAACHIAMTLPASSRLHCCCLRDGLFGAPLNRRMRLPTLITLPLGRAVVGRTGAAFGSWAVAKGREEEKLLW